MFLENGPDLLQTALNFLYFQQVCRRGLLRVPPAQQRVRLCLQVARVVNHKIQVSGFSLLPGRSRTPKFPDQSGVGERLNCDACILGAIP